MYDAFPGLIADASIRVPMWLLVYCLMPNHFHLVLRHRLDGDLSRWMHWLMTVRVRRYLRHYHSNGQVWQGRFKAFPIQQDDHLVTVLRYVERNPLRAGIVPRSQDWPWSSLSRPSSTPALNPGPVPRGPGWVEYVNSALFDSECDRIRHSIARGAPFGSWSWSSDTAVRLGLESSLRPRGRPRQVGPTAIAQEQGHLDGACDRREGEQHC